MVYLDDMFFGKRPFVKTTPKGKVRMGRKDETDEEMNERLQREAAADTSGDETDEEMNARLQREAENEA